MQKEITLWFAILLFGIGNITAQNAEKFFTNNKAAEFEYEAGAMDIGAKGTAKVNSISGNIIVLDITSYMMGPDYFQKKNPKQRQMELEFKNGEYIKSGKSISKGKVYKNDLTLYYENDEYGSYERIVAKAVNNTTVTKNNDTQVKDGDGYVYKTVVIGNKEWMAENLNTIKYNDGTPIANITEAKAWVEAKAGAYCWYDNKKADAVNKNYGALYNWYAVNTGKLCPTGWHLPSLDDWKALAKYVSEEKAALKSKSGWKKDNINAGNGADNYGFAATPAGGRFNTYGIFNGAGSMVQYWVSDQYYDQKKGLFFHINNNPKPFNTTSHLKFSSYKYDGLSVRCVRNASNKKQNTNFTVKPNKFYKIKVTEKGAFINIENGLACGNIAPGWHSAQWFLEPVEGKYYKIKNRWKNTYLHIERGSVECSEIAPGWHSAQWIIEHQPGTNQVKIKNRWKQTYLYQSKNTGKLICSDNIPKWINVLWELEEMK